MKSIEFSSEVKNNKLVKNVWRLKEIVQHFNGKHVLIKISLLTEKRSNQQNRYYWGVIIPIVQKGLEDMQGCLFSKYETHQFLKSQFNYEERVNEDTGELLNFPKSTTENTKKDMEIFNDKIRKFASDWLNVEIPLPNEQLKLE